MLKHKKTEIILAEYKAAKTKQETCENIYNEILAGFKSELYQYIHDNFVQEDKDTILKILNGAKLENEDPTQEKRPPPPPQEEDLVTTSKKDETPMTFGCKRLFKKIARKTHPDHHPDDTLKSKMFQDASSALKKDDLIKLRDLASDLQIELPPITQEQENFIKKTIKDIEDRIQFYEKTYPWMWFQDNQNKKWLKAYLKNAVQNVSRA